MIFFLFAVSIVEKLKSRGESGGLDPQTQIIYPVTPFTLSVNNPGLATLPSSRIADSSTPAVVPLTSLYGPFDLGPMGHRAE
jgi:hypothetical protein